MLEHEFKSIKVAKLTISAIRWFDQFDVKCNV